MKRRNQAAIEHNVKYMRWLTDKEAVVMYTVIRCHIQRIKFKFMINQNDINFTMICHRNFATKWHSVFEDKDLKFIIDNLYPDIRRIVNTLQRSSLSGKLVTDRSISLSSEKIIISNVVEIISFIQSGEDHKINNVINNLVKILGELDLDFRTIYSDLFFRVEVPTNAKIIINKYFNKNCF